MSTSICWGRTTEVPMTAGAAPATLTVSYEGTPVGVSPVRLGIDGVGIGELTPDEAIRLARSLEQCALAAMGEYR